MGETAKNWRIVYKSLILLEHFIRYGSDRCIDEARDRIFVLKQLQDFHFVDGEGVDRGSAG